MFSSPILEIIIGLFFVYLLLSLLATALNELVMTYLNARGKGLLMGIQKLVDDNDTGQKLSNLVVQSPMFKKLYRPGSQRMPSYLNANRFVEIFVLAIRERKLIGEFVNSIEALIDSFPKEIKNKLRMHLGDLKKMIAVEPIYGLKNPPRNPWELVKGLFLWLFNIKKHIERIVAALSTVVFWVARTILSMFRNNTSLSVAAIRSNVLNDLEGSLKDVQTLIVGKKELEEKVEVFRKQIEQVKKQFAQVQTEPLTMEDLREAIESLQEGDTKTLLSSLMAAAGESLDDFKQDVEHWFDEVMEHVAGWYRRKVQIFLLIIGLIISIAFNADTFNIARTLHEDPAARAQLVDLAIQYTQATSAATPSNPDSIGMESGEDQIRALRRQVEGLIDNELRGVRSLLGLGWDGWDNVYRVYMVTDASIDSLRRWEVDDGVVEAMRFNVFKVDTALSEIAIARSAGSVVIGDGADTTLAENMEYPVRAGVVYIQTSDTLFLNPDRETIDRRVRTAGYRGKTVFLDRLKRLLSAEQRVAYEASILEASLIEKGGFRQRLTYGVSHIWGWIFTAIAISLGAPFWFDLLKKITNLRGAVRKPDETASKQ